MRHAQRIILQNYIPYSSMACVFSQEVVGLSPSNMNRLQGHTLPIADLNDFKLTVRGV